MGDQPLLIIFAGLPGTGKTTLAKELAERLGAVFLRVDSIEQAIVQQPQLHFDDMEDAGYKISHAIAADNLQLGRTVIADQVNDFELTRQDWLSVATRANCLSVEIEIICSDPVEHQKRVEARKADITGHTLPTWQEVLERGSDHYHKFNREHITIDTAGKTVTSCLDEIEQIVQE